MISPVFQEMLTAPAQVANCSVEALSMKMTCVTESFNYYGQKKIYWRDMIE